MNQQLNSYEDQNNPQSGQNTVQLKYKLNQQEYFKINKDIQGKKQHNFKNNTLTLDKQDDEVDQIFRVFKEKEDNLKKEIEIALNNSLCNTRSLKKQRDETSPIIVVNRNCSSRNESRNKERPQSNQGSYSLTKPQSNYLRNNTLKNGNLKQDENNQLRMLTEEEKLNNFQNQEDMIQFIKKNQDETSIKKHQNILNKSLEDQYHFQEITDQVRNVNRQFNNKKLLKNNPSPIPKLQEITMDRQKNLSQISGNSNQRRSQVKQTGSNEHHRQQSATLQTSSSKQTTSNVIQNKSGVRRMESPILFQNPNIMNNPLNPNKVIQQANYKKQRLQHLSDYSSLNNTLTITDKGHNIKTPSQTSPQQIGLERRRLKTLNDYSTSITHDDNFISNKSKLINNISQKLPETPERSKTLQNESSEGFKVFQLHDNLVNYQKQQRPIQNNDNYQTISYYQTSSTNNKDSKNINHIQDSSNKGQNALDKTSKSRNKTAESRIEQISQYVKPMLQYQAETCWGQTQPQNNIISLRSMQSHTLEPLTTTEDSESKKQQIGSSSKTKNKNYANNNFNYKLKILRGTLKRNQLSPENFIQSKLNGDFTKENSIIIEENPSQQNLHSYRNVNHMTATEEWRKFDNQEQKVEKKKEEQHSSSPQQNSRNKEVLKKFLTKTKQIKSKNFIENLETDNTCADDSCQEQMNTIDDFKTLYAQPNQLNNSKLPVKKQLQKNQNDENNLKKQNNNRNQQYVQLQNQSYLCAQQQLIQEAQTQKLNKKNVLRSSDQIDKDVTDQPVQKQNVKQIYSKLTNFQRNNRDSDLNPPSVKHSQNFRKSNGSPNSLRDSFGGNQTSIIESTGGINAGQEQTPLSRDDIEILRFQEEKKKWEKQKFAPYKIDQMQQFVNLQSFNSLSSKNQNQSLITQQSQQISQQQNSQQQNNQSQINHHQRYSFSFQYQQNIQDPQQIQQQILLQTQQHPHNVQQSPQILPLRNISQINKGGRLAAFGINDVYYGVPIPTNFGVSPMQQNSSSENFSPHFSQQFQDHSQFQKLAQQNSIKQSQQSRKNSSQQSMFKENSKQQNKEEDNGRVLKISQLGDQCPPTPTKITLEYLQKKTENEDNYHTAFYNNQMYVQHVVKENFYGNSSHFQQKMQAVSQSINQQDKKIQLEDNTLQEVSSNILNEKLNKNIGQRSQNMQGIEDCNRLIILQKTNNQLKAETFIDQAKFTSEDPRNSIKIPHQRTDEPTKSIII